MLTETDMFGVSSSGGLVVEHLLHNKCHSTTVDRIPSKYGGYLIKIQERAQLFMLYHLVDVGR